ncbi:MAG TPA: hypothetical protein PKC98_20455 [Candidatus Melainabacteria bacterium]|nr:hypothetical protein [Candidatus Melainabacteria bacterium]
MKIEKLNRHDFARALANGQGKAFLHVKQYGDRGIEKEILYACLNCQVYDLLFDKDRSFWLSNVIANSGRMAFYADKILNHLRQDLKPGNTLDQIVFISAELFDRGYGEFKPVLEQLFETHQKNGQGDSALYPAMIDIYAYKGLARAACAMESCASIDDWEKDSLFCYACESLDNEENVTRWFEEKSVGDKQLASFYKAVLQYRKAETRSMSKRRTRSKGPKTPSYRQALSIINNNNESHLRKIYPLRRFGKAATEAQLNKLASKLEQEQNPDKIIAYLTEFRDRPLPVVSERVLSFLFSEDADLRRSAMNALCKVKLNDVRSAALKLLAQGDDESICYGVNLLELNYRSTDRAMLLAKAKEVKDIDNLHWVCNSLIDIGKNCESANFTSLALWAYENTPCGFCREQALEILIKWGKASKRILFEAQWDANDDIRILARKTFT